jgi:hypothetical protein
MSRPFWSAPRKKRPCHVGPVGIPSVDTTLTFLPPTLTTSVTWLAFGPVCATCFAYTGARKQARQMARKIAPATSAA